MGAVNTTYTFTATDVITSTKMNNIIDQTTITGDAIFGTTLEVVSGKLKIRSQGITSNEMGTSSVTTTNLVNGSITPVKLSTGAPNWNTSGGFTVNGGGTELSHTTPSSAIVSIGGGRTANGSAYIDFNAAFPVTSYETRIIRGSGANGSLQVLNNGTGGIYLDSAIGPIVFNDVPLGDQSGDAPIYGARAFAKCNPLIGSDNSQAFKNGSYSAAVGTVVTVTIVNHNLKANDKIRLVFTRTSGTGTVPSSSTVFNVVSKISDDVFTVAFTSAAISNGTVVAWFVKVDSSKNISSVTFYNTSNSAYVFNFDVPMPTSDFAISGAGQYYPGAWTSTIAEYNDSGTSKLNTVNNAYIASSNDSRFISVIIFA